MYVDYWREGNYEVDFVLSDKSKIVVFEVKSGRKSRSLPGIKKFQAHHKSCKPLLIGGQGISLETFLSKSVSKWV